ncbi:hypothetical protein A4R35_00290 [Thermogemmatispora tikiterensis]|uniref:Uncharacterized protein n=1 Tax=Thermogemmatispora tikiterensis TaxID=1825093 RepID=A0A328V8S6_9CHLR|nr:hypothetical protein A4R35_00290 [Thermogemmatispora tikiterensis]
MSLEKSRQASRRNQVTAVALICQKNSLSYPMTSQVHNLIRPFYQRPL